MATLTSDFPGDLTRKTQSVKIKGITAALPTHPIALKQNPFMQPVFFSWHSSLIPWTGPSLIYANFRYLFRV
jgi:hypothetical protein